MTTPTLPATGSPQVPVSWGELIDKITILEIKSRRLAAEQARANVARELALLTAKLPPAFGEDAVLGQLKQALTEVNEALWKIEDDIRAKEAGGTFDDGFIQLARAVYITNDRRAEIKRRINLLTASELIEEKGYAPYRAE